MRRGRGGGRARAAAALMVSAMRAWSGGVGGSGEGWGVVMGEEAASQSAKLRARACGGGLGGVVQAEGDGWEIWEGEARGGSAGERTAEREEWVEGVGVLRSCVASSRGGEGCVDILGFDTCIRSSVGSGSACTAVPSWPTSCEGSVDWVGRA